MNWSAVLLIASLLLLPPWPGAAPAEDAPDPAAAGREDHDDEFNGTSLDPKWSWFNPPAAFDVGATTPGCLHVVSRNGTNFGPGATNGTVLYQNLSGDIVLETKLNATPQNGVEKTGLILYNSADNWMALKYQVDGGGPYVEVGVQDTSGFGNLYWTQVTANPIWLRLVKEGLKLTTFHSTDGASWTEQFNYTQTFTEPFMGGLLVSDGYADSNFSVDFDHFRFGRPNQAPVLSSAFLPITFNEDQGRAIGVLDHFRDPEGAELTFKVEAPHVQGAFDPVLGDIELRGPPDWSGTNVVRLTASDPQGLKLQTSFNVTVLPVEDPPVLAKAFPDLRMAQNSTSGGPDLSKHFGDADLPYGDRLSYGVQDSWALLVDLTPAGKVTISAPIDFHGAVVLTFTAADRTGANVSGTCKVTVSHVNQAPQVVSAPPEVVMYEDESLTRDLSPCFRDPDGDAISLVPSGNARVDVIQSASPLLLTFRPKPDASGFTETIAVTARDEWDLGENFVLVDVTVLPVNDQPRILQHAPVGGVVMKEAQGQEFNITARDAENGTALEYTWYLDGRPVLHDVPVFVFRADYRAAGNHTVRVTVGDGELTASRSWNLTVLNVNREPDELLVDAPRPADVYDAGQPVTFKASAVDADGEDLEFLWYEGSRLLGTGRNLSLVLPAGDHAVVLWVSDGIDSVDGSKVRFTVKANTLPQLGSLSPYNGQRFEIGARIHFKAEAWDGEGDALTYCWTENGLVLSWAPEFNLSTLPAGTHVMSLAVFDGKDTLVTLITIEIAEAPAGGPGPDPAVAVSGAAALAGALAAVFLVRRKRPPDT